jgi:predicted enzyme related to lactoylglutathione lyase
MYLKKQTVKLVRVATFGALMATVGACASSGPAVTLNPVTPAPTGTHKIGKFVWYDLVTEDVPAVKRFYSELFGWRYEEIQGDDVVYTVIRHDETAIGGIVALDADDDRVPSSRWLSTLSVEDVDAAADLIESAGGTVNMDPRDVPDRGRLALITDPQGAMVLLARTTGGDPLDVDPDARPIANRWMWTELWAYDVGAAFELYASLVGYHAETFDIPGDTDYQVLMRDGRRRAGIIHLPWQEVTPNWLPYVNVKDPVATAARVEELGGQVLIPPRPDIRNGSVGVVTDPSGAAFAIQKWPVDDEETGGAP